MKDIFLSYSSKDISTANILYSLLHKAGYSIWFAAREANFGEELSKVIVKNIKESEYFLGMVTNDWMNSKYCQLEFSERKKHCSENKILMNCFLIAEKNFDIERNSKFIFLCSDIREAVYKINQHSRKFGIEHVKRCCENLINGILVEESSDALARSIKRFPSLKKLDLIWNAVLTTKWPNISIDLAARAIHYGVREIRDIEVHKKCISLLTESTSTDNPIIIDKFAYTAGNLCIYTWQLGIVQHFEYRKFIVDKSGSNSKLISEAYQITDARVSEWINMLQNQRVQKKSNLDIQ